MGIRAEKNKIKSDATLRQARVPQVGFAPTYRA